MMPEEIVQRWEAAYRRYGEASKAIAVAYAGDEYAVREMVVASQDVAAAFRALESIPDLPWWVLAAVSAAAQAFTFQARDWSTDVINAQAAKLLGPGRRLSSRAQPTPHRRDGAAGDQR